MLKKIVFTALTLSSLLAGSAAQASGRTVDVWRSSDGPGHYFRRDYASNSYVETVDCRRAFTFQINQLNGDSVRLYDPSRKLYVHLQNGAMWLWADGATQWTRYRNGSFDHRFLFGHRAAGGSQTSWFNLLDGCRWHETVAGGGFDFVETGKSASAVVMYDSSRNLFVKLEETVMSLRSGGAGAFNFYHYGSWQ